ncbi:hypothetical protein LguiA_007846 [Lonicera macranthoides]
MFCELIFRILAILLNGWIPSRFWKIENQQSSANTAELDHITEYDTCYLGGYEVAAVAAKHSMGLLSTMMMMMMMPVAAERS